jgi:type II secretory pathway pseudopilin PulG
MKPIEKSRLNSVLRSRPGTRSRHPRTQRGYALLALMFLVFLLFLATAVAVPRILTQGRRERETDMIWRGEQYTRGIRRFYTKTGRFPTSMEELMKGRLGLHFMRKEYKDPMNTEDGSWRLIYLAPNGQLIGSVRYTTLAQMQISQISGGRFPTTTPTGAGATPGAFGSQFGAPGQQPGAPGQPPGSPGQQPPGNPQGDSGQNPSSMEQNPSTDQPGQQGQQGSGLGTVAISSEQPQGLSTSGGPVVGGTIIGVGSKVDKRSVKVYKGGKTYKQWEFIWNPLAESQISTQSGGVPGATPAGQPGSTPQPNANPNVNPGINPTPNPPLTPPETPPQEPPQQ